MKEFLKLAIKSIGLMLFMLVFMIVFTLLMGDYIG